MNRKYVFVSGGVISGVGKGIASASIAFLLKSYDLKISLIKADPYLNVDAGTMNPLEHGETFVLEDGFETDMDMGHYERFTGELFSRMNSMTSGAIFQRILDKERALEYAGKFVTIGSHVPEEIINWITQVGEDSKADVVIIEIGGTVGEYEQALFLEANRIMKVKNHNDVIHVHVSYLPVPGTLGEMKSKPVQMSVKLLNQNGINPDFIIARAKYPIDDIRREKLSRYCTVEKENVISAPDIDNIYEVPINFEKDLIAAKIVKYFGFNDKHRDGLYTRWVEKYEKINNPEKKVKIALVGKYYKSGDFDLKDSYVSVLEAVKHAAWEFAAEPDIEWFIADELEDDKSLAKKLSEVDGIIVPQGWGSRGSEGKVKAIKIARENKIPYLGLCYGMQMATIEFARNVAGLENANSEEVNSKSPHLVVHMMEEQKKLIAKQKYGGTIRLGAYPCRVEEGTILEALYKKYPNDLFNDLPVVQERHRHRYEFNNKYREQLEEKGLVISGTSPDGLLVEAIELPKDVHPFFVATQYHPELKSQLLQPHPIFLGFVEAALENSKGKGIVKGEGKGKKSQ